MSIQVIVPAPTRNLTSLETLKRALGITDSSQDEDLVSLIAASSDYVCNYCGREFAMQTIRESVKSEGIPNLLLSLTPITEVQKVEYRDGEVDGWTVYDADAGILQKPPAFSSTMFAATPFDGQPSGFGKKDWHVTYTGGYILPDWGDSQGDRTLPYDLERAVLDLCRAQFAKAKIDPTVMDPEMTKYKIGDTEIQWGGRGKTSGGGGSSSGDNSGGLLPLSAKAILDYYRRAF